jgi:hypothetical protein
MSRAPSNLYSKYSLGKIRITRSLRRISSFTRSRLLVVLSQRLKEILEGSEQLPHPKTLLPASPWLSVRCQETIPRYDLESSPSFCSYQFRTCFGALHETQASVSWDKHPEYSLKNESGNAARQRAAWQSRSNHLPMRPLGYLSPIEFLDAHPVQHV